MMFNYSCFISPSLFWMIKEYTVGTKWLRQTVKHINSMPAEWSWTSNWLVKIIFRRAILNSLSAKIDPFIHCLKEIWPEVWQ